MTLRLETACLGVEVQIILCHSALLLLHQRFHDLTLNRKPTAKHIETDPVAEAAKEQVASSFLEATMFLISAMSGDGVMSDLSCRKAKPMCQSANACIHGETAEPSCLMPLIPAASLMHIIPPKSTLSQLNQTEQHLHHLSATFHGDAYVYKY